MIDQLIAKNSNQTNVRSHITKKKNKLKKQTKTKAETSHKLDQYL